MRHRIHLRFSLAAAALAMLAGCDSAKSEEAGIEDAWVRLPALPDRPGAAYFTLRAGADPLTLEAIESPQVQRIELHQTVSGPGRIASMAKIERVEIAARGSAAFAPGGRHAMLFGIDPSVKPGDTIRLTFKLRPTMEITAEAQVRGVGESHEGH